MDGLLELLIELENAGVRELRRAGDSIAIDYFSHLSIITPLSVRLRLGEITPLRRQRFLLTDICGLHRSGRAKPWVAGGTHE